MELYIHDKGMCTNYLTAIRYLMCLYTLQR